MFGFGRKNDGPAMSIVYYVLDGDDILVSTMSARGKAKAVARNPKVSLPSSTSSGRPRISSCTETRRSRRTSMPPRT